MGRKRTKQIEATPLSQKLAELRTKRGFSLEELGALVEVSATYIRMLESGERQPSRELVLKLAALFFSPYQTHQMDELLLLAGFSPIHQANLSLVKDLLELKAEAAESEQDNFQAFSTWVMALLKNNHLEEAQKALQMGFQRFQDHLQLKSLLALLELSRGNYLEAIEAQNQAIEAYLSLKPENIKLSDLKLNLGEMYFLRAVHQAEIPQEARTEALGKACEILHEASSLAPEDVYILDEFARCSFNWAQCLDTPASKPVWQQTISAFQSVIRAENKQDLGGVVLNEAALFLALALAKTEDFQAAFSTLDLVSIYQPESWLLHYIRAVCLCLNFQQKQAPELLALASSALQKALLDTDPSNRTLSEAQADPDLSVLMAYDPELFQKIQAKSEEQAR